MSKLVLAALAAALLAGPALAQETSSALVRTGHVNFNDQSQAQQVYKRVEAAARSVCTIQSDNKYIATTDRECMDKAIAQAVTRTNKPTLTAAYNASAQANNHGFAGNDQ